MLYSVYFVVLFLFSLYSYALVDPNITYFQNSLWTNFREFMVQIGYYNRPLSWYLYLFFVGAMFILHFAAWRRFKKVNLKYLSILIVVALFIAYPLLSHDVFNYMFDARILTVYGKNPYLYKALDFPSDNWLRFMHWTHRTYPYGPTFLPITLVPSLLSFGKFILNVIFFKLLFVGAYFLGIYSLSKIDKRAAVFFATQPLVLVEGLVNTHNDLLSVSLALYGIYLLLSERRFLARIFLLFSAGIKYMTFSMLIVSRHKKSPFNIAALVGVVGVLLYLTVKSEIQPWYFVTLLAFLPYFAGLLYSLEIFFAGLLLSYYPYIRFGGWGEREYVVLKHQIIWIVFVINIIFLLYYIAFQKKGIIRLCSLFSTRKKHFSKKRK